MKKTRMRILSACICLVLAWQTAPAQPASAPLPGSTVQAATGVPAQPASTGVAGSTAATSVKPAPPACAPVCYPQQLPLMGIILVYLPPVLFLFIMLGLYRWARREKLKLADLLAERNLPDNHPATATGAAELQKGKAESLATMKNAGVNLTEDAILPATAAADPTSPPPSTSRLILILAGLAAVIISIVLFSYNMYSLQRYGIAPDWGSVTGILLSLGIGVTPYAVKQVFK